ncbi:unnamed protein product [Spodoptera littoralis]|uniref:Uncharacterized protein n=1 Tax=Spodoptera littoralis TaxID=7109 RepID=A0A9P0I9I7_SPOLI|nr:unnamed protein product [Spodoptera littoralis]CAH1641835.1 unnamed protein product [Spodoptera littoralis]
MFTKVVALFCLVAVAAATDLTVGKREGRLIFYTTITARPTIWKQVQNLTVNATDDALITRVVVVDNRPQKDGVAKLVDGGVGHNNVTIELKSPTVFRGFNFTVKVFEKKVAMQKPRHPVFVGANTQKPVPVVVYKPQEAKPTPSPGEAHNYAQVTVKPAALSAGAGSPLREPLRL